MQLTREAVARKLAAYLHHEIPLNELVAWANIAMMEADFEEAYYDSTSSGLYYRSPWPTPALSRASVWRMLKEHT